MSDQKIPKVFISYAHDKEGVHIAQVREFYHALRSHYGVDATFDEAERQKATALNFDKLTLEMVNQFDKVIIVLSENYKRKADNFQGGVWDEYQVIFSDLKRENNKYILVSFEPLRDEIVPQGLRGRDCLDLTDPNNQALLANKLKGVGTIEVPPINLNPTIQPFVNKSPTGSIFGPSPTPDSPEPAQEEGDIKQQVNRKLRRGALKEALDLLSDYADAQGDSHLSDSIIMQYSRYSSLERDRNTGTVSQERLSIVENQILQALLSIVKDL